VPKPTLGVKSALVALVLGIAPEALAQPTPEAVIVASTAPAAKLGQIVRAGETILIPSGASVTLLEQSGAFLTLEATGPYAPSIAPTRARNFDPARLLAAVAALVSDDEADVQMRPFRGGPDANGCAGVAPDGPIAAVPALLSANCRAAAERRLRTVMARTIRLQVFISEIRPSASGALEVDVLANRDAGVRCGADATGGESQQLRSSRTTTLQVARQPGQGAVICAGVAEDDPAQTHEAQRAIDPL
jgi:hypothetical protein